MWVNIVVAVDSFTYAVNYSIIANNNNNNNNN